MPNEMFIRNLTDKDVKEKIMKKLTEFGRIMMKHSETFGKELEKKIGQQNNNNNNNF